MKTASTRSVCPRAVRILIAPVLVSLSVGWLGSGSCQISYCSENCDPCVRQCVCKSSVCAHTQATFAATHALVDYEVVEFHGEGAGARRTYVEITGLSVQRAGGPAQPDKDDLVGFARGVLAVNARLFALSDREPAFVLDAVEKYETAWVVEFHSDAPQERGERASTQTFLFDTRGNLVEIDQAIDG